METKEEDGSELMSTFLHNFIDNYPMFHNHYMPSATEVISMGFYLLLFMIVLLQNKELRMKCVCIEKYDDTEI